MALRVCRKYNSVLYSYIGWEIDELSSTPSHHNPLSHPPTTPIPYLYTYWDGLWVSQRVWGGGAELVNQPLYVGVEHRIKLAANAQCQIRIRFILLN